MLVLILWSESEYRVKQSNRKQMKTFLVAKINQLTMESDKSQLQHKELGRGQPFQLLLNGTASSPRAVGSKNIALALLFE